MSAQPEVWRVSTIEGVFETDLDTLRQWIIEGCVLPTDKVSKGTLNWIDAGRVPKLKKAFNGEVEPPTLTLVPEKATTENAWQTPPITSQDEVHEESGRQAEQFTSPYVAAAPSNVCQNHPEVQPKYLCRMCAAALCDQCPKYVGSTKIPVCPFCGDLCKSYSEVTSKTARAEFQSSGFGLSDLGRAIKYPFQHKIALLSGALLYGFLLIAGFRGSLVAWAIMFGCISHVISQVAWGRLDRSFMPDFSSFSIVDDFVMPIFLGIGITIVSWGPVIVLVLALVFGVVSSGAVSGSSAGTSGSEVAAANQEELNEEDLDVLLDPNADPKKLEEANKKMGQLRPGHQIAQEAERSTDQQNDPTGMVGQLLPYLGAGILILGLLFVGLAWAIFYYPMALTVAGYTQSFWSVLNPLVGIDTIKRMRGTYFKAFGMVILIQFVGLIVSGIVTIVTSPLTLSFVGNIFANFINGAFTFYFNLVIACLLGLSLFKCADRLGISVD